MFDKVCIQEQKHVKGHCDKCLEKYYACSGDEMQENNV